VASDAFPDLDMLYLERVEVVPLPHSLRVVIQGHWPDHTHHMLQTDFLSWDAACAAISKALANVTQMGADDDDASDPQS